jgi:voltage-gated potassium channel
MVLGYGIIAVPTGIVSAEYTAQGKKINPNEPAPVSLNSQSCENCLATKHSDKAEYCYNCGERLYS